MLQILNFADISFIAEPSLAPKRHLGEDRHEALADIRERVLHLRRNLSVYLTMDQPVGLQLTQLLGEGRLGYAVDPSHELTEPLHLIAGDIPEDEYLPLPAEHRLHPAHGFAASHRLLVSELVISHLQTPRTIPLVQF